MSHSNSLLTSLILAISAVERDMNFEYIWPQKSVPVLPLQKTVTQLLPSAVASPCSELGFVLKSACQSEKQKYAQDLIFLLFFPCHCNLDLKIILGTKSAKIQYEAGKYT